MALEQQASQVGAGHPPILARPRGWSMSLTIFEAAPLTLERA